MFNSTLRIIVAAACLCLPIHVAAQTSYAPPPQAGEFDTIATVDIGVNGKVSRVVTDPSLQAAVREPLVARVSQWEFEAPTFQGRPAQINARLWVRLQLAPTTSGGYGIRVVRAQLIQVPSLGSLPGLRFAGHPKEDETLVYVVSIDAEGRNAGAELALPKKLSRAARALDTGTRFALAQALPFQRTVDGHAVTCRIVFTMTLPKAGPSAPPPSYTGETQALADALADKCPKTQLLTEVAGTTL